MNLRRCFATLPPMTTTARSAALLAACLAVAARAAPPTTAPDALEAIGREVAAAAGSHDAAAFARHFDIEAMVDRTARGLAPDVAAGLRVEIRPAIEQMLASMVANLTAQSRVDLLRARSVDGERRLTCRVTAPNGLNYWDLIVVPATPDAPEPKVVDLLSASMGELASVTIRRLLLASLPDGKPADEAAIKAATDFRDFAEAARNGDARDALQRFESLPASYQQDKTTLLLRVVASSHLKDDPAAVAVAADAFKGRFGDDPACDLLMVNIHLARGQTAEAVACVDRIDAAVGGDPYLDYLRSNLFAAGKDRAAAREYAARAFERDPSLLGPVNTLLTYALQDGDFEDAKRWLLTIERSPTFGLRFNADFDGNAYFAEFVKSPQYAEWLRERPTAP